MLQRILFSIFILLLASLAVYSLLEPQAAEHPSPSDWIKENQIQVYPQGVILHINNASWATFTNTNSMDPFLDEESNAIEIKPTSAQQVRVGDIISYNTSNGIVIHRVTETGTDQDGPYFIAKGDNNRFADTQKIRLEDIQGVVIAIIY